MHYQLSWRKLVYGVVSIDTFYLFVGIQILLNSIPQFQKFCYAGWFLLAYDAWVGFCWILAHLLANTYITANHRYHIIFIVIGIALPLQS